MAQGTGVVHQRLACLCCIIFCFALARLLHHLRFTGMPLFQIHIAVLFSAGEEAAGGAPECSRWTLLQFAGKLCDLVVDPHLARDDTASIDWGSVRTCAHGDLTVNFCKTRGNAPLITIQLNRSRPLWRAGGQRCCWIRLSCRQSAPALVGGVVDTVSH